tara:strand:+ start:696 stop:839 length:144 start_codon:yes stop_codon:yes gene_type:complete
MGRKEQTSITSIMSIPKKTTIGGGKLGMSTFNKHKRRSYKKYRGQGR